MKKVCFLLLWSIFLIDLAAQAPEAEFRKSELEGHLRYLASDELMGRRTGEPGNDLAAVYLAEYFRTHGLQTPPGQDHYFQHLNIQRLSAPETVALRMDSSVLQSGEDFLLLAGPAAEVEGPAVFAAHGWVSEDGSRDDYAGLDVAGKVVFVLPGIEEGDGRRAIFEAMQRKQELAAERGAVALIELYRLSFPWRYFVNYFGRSSRSLLPPGMEPGPGPIPYGWLKETPGGPVARLLQGEAPTVALQTSGAQVDLMTSRNVVGIIEGTDPELRDEYVLLTAHYDHVGTGGSRGAALSETDTIFNGARDNGIGTVALMAAAQALAGNPPRRSVILLAVTGEEMGMLGSSYYARYPLIPLRQTIFNLNSDGAGYNDIRYVSIIGYDRTGVEGLIDEAVSTYGLEVFPDPAPEENLFDRSDNVSFAGKGVPALNFSPGMTTFDEEIRRHYHQVTDEADSLDYDYLLQFWQAYARAARLIADRTQRPWWVEGDKYEEVGRALYGQ